MRTNIFLNVLLMASIGFLIHSNVAVGQGPQVYQPPPSFQNHQSIISANQLNAAAIANRAQTMQMNQNIANRQQAMNSVSEAQRGIQSRHNWSTSTNGGGNNVYRQNSGSGARASKRARNLLRIKNSTTVGLVFEVESGATYRQIEVGPNQVNSLRLPDGRYSILCSRATEPDVPIGEGEISLFGVKKELWLR